MADAHPDAPAVEAAALTIAKHFAALIGVPDDVEITASDGDRLCVREVIQALVDGGHYVPAADVRPLIQANGDAADEAIDAQIAAEAERDSAVARAEASEAASRFLVERIDEEGNKRFPPGWGGRIALAIGDAERQIRFPTVDCLAVFDNPVTPEARDE